MATMVSLLPGTAGVDLQVDEAVTHLLDKSLAGQARYFAGSGAAHRFPFRPPCKSAHGAGF